MISVVFAFGYADRKAHTITNHGISSEFSNRFAHHLVPSRESNEMGKFYDNNRIKTIETDKALPGS